jgi:hypothetical protein
MTTPYPEMYHPAPEWTPAPAPTPDSASANIATWAMVISVLSLLLALIPFFGTPAWATGLALSIVALSRLRNGGQGRGRAFIGLGTAVISGALSLFVSVLLFITVIDKHDPHCTQPSEPGNSAATACGPRR